MCIAGESNVTSLTGHSQVLKNASGGIGRTYHWSFHLVARLHWSLQGLPANGPSCVIPLAWETAVVIDPFKEPTDSKGIHCKYEHYCRYYCHDLHCLSNHSLQLYTAICVTQGDFIVPRSHPQLFTDVWDAGVGGSCMNECIAQPHIWCVIDIVKIWRKYDRLSECRKRGES